MNRLARRLVIAWCDEIGHRSMLYKLSHIDLLIIDDNLTVGSDSNAASDGCKI